MKNNMIMNREGLPFGNVEDGIVLTPEGYNHLLQQAEGSKNTNVNITPNTRYRVKFEKAASANKIDGFVVEANGDVLDETFSEALKLYDNAIAYVELKKPVPPAPSVKSPNGA